MSGSKSFINTGVLVTFFIVGALIVPGYGLKCYICDSLKNPGCIDLKRHSGIEPETCRLDRMVSMDNWLTELYKIDFHPMTHYEKYEYRGPMYCQKVVASKDGETITARFCQIDTAQTDPCNLSQDKLRNDPSVRIESCSICDSDACNSAPKFMAGFSILIVLIITFFGKYII